MVLLNGRSQDRAFSSVGETLFPSRCALQEEVGDGVLVMSGEAVSRFQWPAFNVAETLVWKSVWLKLERDRNAFIIFIILPVKPSSRHPSGNQGIPLTSDTHLVNPIFPDPTLFVFPLLLPLLLFILVILILTQLHPKLSANIPPIPLRRPADIFCESQNTTIPQHDR